MPDRHKPKFKAYKLVDAPGPSGLFDAERTVLVEGNWFVLEDLPEGEPVFVLRAQDAYAEEAIAAYVNALARDNHLQMSKAADDHLAEFRAWGGPRKVPD